MTRIKEILKADARYKAAMEELDKLKGIKDEGEREKAIQRSSRLIVAAAYDRSEAYELLAFTLIQSADRLFRASAEMLATVQNNVRYNDRFKLNKAMRALNEIITTLDHESCKIHEDYHLHGEVEDSDLTPFEAIDKNSEVLLHFNMLLFNALKMSKGNAKMLEKYLDRLKGEGEPVFTKKEIASL